MSTTEFSIAYDGPALAQHVMYVQQLGPALLAIGNLCREANRVINGGNAADVEVHVRATTEGCFDITFQLVQLYDGLSELVQDENVASAKDIAEWIGLIGSGVTLLGGGLLGFLKWKRGRKIVNQESEIDGDGHTVFKITVVGDGDNSITIHETVYNISRDARVRAAQRQMLSPLNSAGVDELQVRQ